MPDNDWPVQPRRIAKEEWDHFPKHNDPGPPTDAQREEHRRQLDEEKEKGHPAHKVKLPPEEE